MFLAHSELLLMCLIFLSCEAIMYEGDNCETKNSNGTIQGRCLSAYNCSWALERIQKREHTDLCSFNGKIPIVCCPDKILEGTKASFKTIENTALFTLNSREKDFGKLSQAKCYEFYPHKTFFPYAYGARKSLPEEFPHMAILGFGESNDKQWKCGGSLITLQHILTAAHCLYSRDFGDVKYVRLGDLDLKNSTDPAQPQDFIVKRFIRHPDYDSSTVAHDIAILELDRPATLTDFVKPACLHLGGLILPNHEISATGWGITQFSGEPSEHLLAVSLKIVDEVDCRKQYSNAGPRGNIDSARQVCAGSADNNTIMDTCQGDSGGPLQIKNYTYYPRQQYNIIGITSFGKACGITNSAGIYTRVSYYIPWIEEVVFRT